MNLPTEITDYLHREVLQNTRCLAVSLNALAVVTDIDQLLGDWSVKGVVIGQPLPETLAAVVDATPEHSATVLFPFINLDDGQVIDVHVCTQGSIHQMILLDVSEVHQAELKLQQKAHQISLLLEKQAELNRLLELQRAEVERASQAKSRFIASMSHEFRTPITSIMGHADMLARQMTDVSLPAAIQRASWHLLTLVENLLEHARQGESSIYLNSGPVDLKILLNDMRDLFSVQAEARSLELRIIEPAANVEFETDELRLRQVLINLLSNAIRYTTEGWVELKVSEATEGLDFHVRDSGPGIPIEDQEVIFQPFMRLNPARESGAGLGLTITRQLVDALSGQLQLDSAPGRGSTFHFSLPIRLVDDPQLVVDLDGLNVLLVDDDPDVLAIYELYLQDWGMQVICASGLAQALGIVGQQKFDLVITDLYLEEGEGTELLKAVRAQQEKCKTILCTGAGLSADWQEHYGDLADGCLLKPIGADHLRTAITRILGADFGCSSSRVLGNTSGSALGRAG